MKDANTHTKQLTHGVEKLFEAVIESDPIDVLDAALSACQVQADLASEDSETGRYEAWHRAAALVEQAIEIAKGAQGAR